MVEAVFGDLQGLNLEARREQAAHFVFIGVERRPAGFSVRVEEAEQHATWLEQRVHRLDVLGAALDRDRAEAGLLDDRVVVLRAPLRQVEQFKCFI